MNAHKNSLNRCEYNKASIDSFISIYSKLKLIYGWKYLY